MLCRAEGSEGRRESGAFLLGRTGKLAAETGLGYLLQNMREERGLSLGELAQLAGIDHAYIG
jgi:hypothetical protein